MARMRILVVAGGTEDRVFPLIPMAQTAHLLGHEVFMAGPENLMDTISAAGVPAISVTRRSMARSLRDSEGHLIPVPTDPHERNIFDGRRFGRYASWCMEGLLELADQWRPDLVVGGALAFAAPLTAARRDVPYVKHAVDVGGPRTVDLAATAELARWLDLMGLQEMPEPDLFIDLCPPALRGPSAQPAQLQRHIPYTAKESVETWMYAKGRRPRVLISGGETGSGSHSGSHSGFGFGFGFGCGSEETGRPERAGLPDTAALAELIELSADHGIELLLDLPAAAHADATRAAFPALLRADHVRVGRIPLDVVAPTCDVVVHQAHGDLVLGGMAHGLPQILIPYEPYCADSADRLAAYGAAEVLSPNPGPHQSRSPSQGKGQGPSRRPRPSSNPNPSPRPSDRPADVLRAVQNVLDTDSYTDRARTLAQEMATLPLPARVIGALEDLVAEQHV